MKQKHSCTSPLPNSYALTDLKTTGKQPKTDFTTSSIRPDNKSSCACAMLIKGTLRPGMWTRLDNQKEHSDRQTDNETTTLVERFVDNKEEFGDIKVSLYFCSAKVFEQETSMGVFKGSRNILFKQT